MIKDMFLYILGLSSFVYFVFDFFLEDTMLYVLGAVLWGVPAVLFDIKLDSIGILLGVLILLLFVLLLYKTKNSLVKFLAIIFIIPLLYVVDFIRMELFPIDIEDVYTRYFKIVISVLSKSIIMSIIVYYGYYREKMKRLNS